LTDSENIDHRHALNLTVLKNYDYEVSLTASNRISKAWICKHVS